MVNGKPRYKKLGNEKLFLTYTNVPKYPTPWTMWGGPNFIPGSHIGNIKIGPSTANCPEHSKVKIRTDYIFLVEHIYFPVGRKLL